MAKRVIERLCLSCDAEVSKMFREMADMKRLTLSSFFSVMVQDTYERMKKENEQ